MRIVFAGTPEVAVPSLRRLHDGSAEIAAVLTRTDAPLGRRRILTPSPVATAASDLDLPIIKANRLDEAATDEIMATRPDLGVIVAYGGLVREPLLSAPEHGWINLHFSLLPRWRGAAPVQHALIAGDRTTGVSVFRLVAALDAGDVYREEPFAIPRGGDAGQVLTALAELGAGVLADVVDDIAAGRAVATPQHGEATHAPKLSAADGALNPEAPVEEVVNRWRGTTPEPGAFVHVDGARVKILEALRGPDIALPPGSIASRGTDVLLGCAGGTMLLRTVQPAGKGAMDAAAWFRGLRGDTPRAHA